VIPRILEIEGRNSLAAACRALRAPGRGWTTEVSHWTAGSPGASVSRSAVRRPPELKRRKLTEFDGWQWCITCAHQPRPGAVVKGPAWTVAMNGLGVAISGTAIRVRSAPHAGIGRCKVQHRESGFQRTDALRSALVRGSRMPEGRLAPNWVGETVGLRASEQAPSHEIASDRHEKAPLKLAHLLPNCPKSAVEDGR
jgi:hypothetical protein